MGPLIDAAIWASLDSAKTGRGLIRMRTAPELPVDVFIAVEKPTGARMLLVGLPSPELAEPLTVPQARGIAIEVIPHDQGEAWGMAEIRLVDLRYGDIFTSLVNDLIGHMAGAQSASEAIERLSDRLRRWESFLRVVDADGLGPERRAGLYGELHVLREQLFPIDGLGAVNSWVGPQSAQQDFQGNGWAIEVKTSRTKEPIAVRISGERQLADAGLRFLGLAHVGVEQRRFNGESLPQMVASVRSLLVGSSVSETFESQLLSAGYLAIHEPLYADEGYTVRFSELFRVEDGFPRILEHDLLEGVGDVAYSVAVSTLGPFKMPWLELVDVVSRNDAVH